ncbi:TIGR04282 family arsenosugar biosynthesis glycosyltransferase [Spirilliplanes yamanashiensis]|uniref:Glycosyl transferase n=1 Tax=Spirilliplanes yamanashiensis TaxID=42233 RepID=A0A8J3Y7J5_9ACTN|nr:DUF2064 domain-containing protein [Spirilliplanes yamanashiensis]MDP9817374.1 rSAM/selenodomain-associated transferase 1 [Spirilliplanes yamanashiensis]GIJ02975.1 glycosyl transferase [Spirilliplanes yamanashiensis]
MSAHLLVLAKAPVAGRVKTRLCPPCTPAQAAAMAAAALDDTLAAGTACGARTRTLVVDGSHPAPPGWAVRPQCAGSLGERLAAAYTGGPEGPVVLVGMDTPQLTATLLDVAAAALGHADAVLGPADDGGWWALGLRETAHADVLRTVPTSTAWTGARTLAALRALGLRVALLPRLRDVDTIADALAVAPLCAPGSRFPAALARVAATVVPTAVPTAAGVAR